MLLSILSEHAHETARRAAAAAAAATARRPAAGEADAEAVEARLEAAEVHLGREGRKERERARGG